MKTIKPFIFNAVTYFLSTTGCIHFFTIKKNGTATTEDRIISNFNKIKLSKDLDIHIRKENELEVKMFFTTAIQ